jgi:hypothetical protein
LGELQLMKVLMERRDDAFARRLAGIGRLADDDHGSPIDRRKGRDARRAEGRAKGD